MNIQIEIGDMVGDICVNRNCSSCPLNGFCVEALKCKEENDLTRLVRKIHKELFTEVSEEEVMSIFK